MRIVKAPQFKKYFKFNSRWSGFWKNFFYSYNLFHSFTLTVFFCCFTLFFGLFNLFLLKVSLSLVCFLLFYYFLLKRSCDGLIIKRTFDDQVEEFSQIKIKYTFYNTSRFPLKRMRMSDRLGRYDHQLISWYLNGPLKSGQSFSFIKDLTVDTGLGEQFFGPIILNFSDPFGFFHFTVKITNTESMRVFPQLKDFMQIPLKGNPDSIHFGLSEVPRTGDATNFFSTREYREGDSIRHINWKLSAKNNELIINEFEKNVNSTLTIVLNMDQDLHMGKGAYSTWDYCKKVAIGVAFSHLHSGNTLRLITNTSVQTFSAGQNSLEQLQKYISDLDLVQDHSPEGIIKRNLNSFFEHDFLYYITPCNLNQTFHENLKAIQRLHGMNYRVIVYLINTTILMEKHFHEIKELNFSTLKYQIVEQIKKHQQILEEKNIEVHSINIKNYRDKILQNEIIARGQIEENKSKR